MTGNLRGETLLGKVPYKMDKDKMDTFEPC